MPATRLRFERRRVVRPLQRDAADGPRWVSSYNEPRADGKFAAFAALVPAWNLTQRQAAVELDRAMQLFLADAEVSG